MPYDNHTELFYLVDENDEVLGSVSRADAHADRSKIHRAVDILITNNANQILLQKRSKFKDTNPGYWTISASGHVTFGQSYDQAATRELREELGLRLPLKFLMKKLFNLKGEQEYSCIYTATTEITPTEFDRTEVEDVTWVNLDKLEEFVAKNKVSPSGVIVLRSVGYLK